MNIFIFLTVILHGCYIGKHQKRLSLVQNQWETDEYTVEMNNCLDIELYGCENDDTTVIIKNCSFQKYNDDLTDYSNDTWGIFSKFYNERKANWTTYIFCLRKWLCLEKMKTQADINAALLTRVTETYIESEMYHENYDLHMLKNRPSKLFAVNSLIQTFVPKMSNFYGKQRDSRSRYRCPSEERPRRYSRRDDSYERDCYSSNRRTSPFDRRRRESGRYDAGRKSREGPALIHRRHQYVKTRINRINCNMTIINMTIIILTSHKIPIANCECTVRWVNLRVNKCKKFVCLNKKENFLFNACYESSYYRNYWIHLHTLKLNRTAINLKSIRSFKNIKNTRKFFQVDISVNKGLKTVHYIHGPFGAKQAIILNNYCNEISYINVRNYIIVLKV